MTIFSVISFLLVTVAIFLFLELTPNQITSDIMKIISPKQTLRDHVLVAQDKKKARKISEALMHIQNAMVETGNGGKFTLVCAASLISLAFGIVIAVMINNVFLTPIFGFACCIVPFLYANSIVHYYEQHIDLELETTLSMISTSYIRSNDIIIAVKENLDYLKPPLSNIFRSFIGEAAINADIKSALIHLRSKIHNDIFEEWCDAPIQCQDDNTLKDTLYPIVNKLTDVRLVNSELTTLLEAVRMEYYVMVGLLVSNIPLIYLINKDWYHTLMYTVPGKITIAICALVILITAGLMIKFTKPIKYKG